MRKSCYQSKKDNPNWGEKIECESMVKINYQITECFIGNPPVLRFNDNLITNIDGLNLSYSCSVK